MALFASYARGPWGGYVQLLEADYLGTPDMTYAGRRTLELGGTRRFEVEDVGSLTVRGGVLVPVGNDNQAGYLASALDAQLWPTDSAASFPSSVAARTSASLVRARAYYVLQADAGIDWIFAGEERAFDASFRANAGIGVGTRAAMASVQLTNAISISDPSRHVDAVAVGATLWLENYWLTATYSWAFTGLTALTLAAGRDL